MFAKLVSCLMAGCLTLTLTLAPVQKAEAVLPALPIVSTAAAGGLAITSLLSAFGINTGVVDNLSAEALFNDFSTFASGVSTEDIDKALAAADLLTTGAFSGETAEDIVEKFRSWGQSGKIDLNALDLTTVGGLHMAALLSLYSMHNVGNVGSDTDWQFPYFIEGANVYYDNVFEAYNGTFELPDFAVLDTNIRDLPNSSITVDMLEQYSRDNELRSSKT